jgi:hypothetical protein
VSEPEPSAWELMRAIHALTRTVESLAANMMTAAMFDIHQRGTDRRIEQVEKDLRDVEGRLDDDSKFRRQVWSSVIVGIFLALFGIVLSLVQAGGQQP